MMQNGPMKGLDREGGGGSRPQVVKEDHSLNDFLKIISKIQSRIKLLKKSERNVAPIEDKNPERHVDNSTNAIENRY